MTNQPKQTTSESRIGKEYYDSSEYFQKAIDRFADLNTPFQQYRITKVLEIYRPHAEERVLDVGCGWGTFSFALAPLCKEVIGIDFSTQSIDLCNQFLGSKGLTNVRFQCADARDTQLPAQSIDTIICADLVEHLYPSDFDLVMDEFRRLLRPGGHVVLWTPNRQHYFEILKNNNILLKREESHVDYKSMERLLDSLNKRRFTIKKHYYAESHFPVLRMIERLLLPFVPWLRRRIAILAQRNDDNLIS